jgi:ADP-heptose:LPS heptosyltransferase
MRSISVFNDKHLGDCILTTHFLRKVCEKHPDIEFDFFAKKGYSVKIQDQIGEFSNQIRFRPLRDKPNGATNMWFACRPLGRPPIKRKRRYVSNENYDLFHNQVCNDWGIENPVPGKMCTVIDHPKILDPVDIECDVLLLNSRSRSGYYRYEEGRFIGKVNEWKDRYKIVTAEPTVEGVPSARDLNLNIIQIGHLATKAQYVISVDTGTIHNCFNKWALDSVKRWYILSNRTTRSFNDRIEARHSIRPVNLP